MKTRQRLSIVLACVLFGMWASTVWTYHAGLQLWKVWRVQMPPLTQLGLALNGMPFVVLMLCGVTVLAFAVAVGPRWTRTLGALFLLLLLALNWGAVLPELALRHTIYGGGAGNVRPPTNPAFSAWTVGVLVVNLLALCIFGVASLRRFKA